MDTDTTKTNTAAPAEQPPKYIRTFAGDMEVAQKGGKPDLVPLVPRPVLEPAIPVVEKPSVPYKTPAKVLDEMSAIAPWITPVEEPKIPEETLERLRAKVAAEKETPPPPQAPIEAVPKAAPEIPPEVASSIHTYADDFSTKVKEEQASTISVLAAEQDAAPVEISETQESPIRKSIFIAAGVLLIVVGGIGGYVGYTSYKAAHAPVAVAPTIFAPIAVDEQEEVPGVGPLLWRAIEESVSKPITTGTVRQLYSTDATTTRESIFVAAQLPAPDIVARNIRGENSMAGIIAAGGKQSPFFILSVSSYNDTFAGMLSWELRMVNDLESLYPAYPGAEVVVPVVTAPVATTTSSASTTPRVEAPVFVPTFHDEVVANHDVRLYRDALGQSIVLYGYWNQTTLVIARDPAAFTEIIARLANARTQP